MKKCNVCNQILDDQAIFCTACGSTDLSQLRPTQPEPQPVPQPEPQPAPQPEPHPVPQPVPQPEPHPVPQPVPQPEPHPVPQPVPQPEPLPPIQQPKRKKKKGLIIAIVSVVVVIALASVSVFWYIDKHRNTPIPFTAGTFSNETHTYENEWADIKINLGPEWTFHSKEELTEMTQSDETYGFAADSATGDIRLSFHDNYAGSTVEDALQKMKDNIAKSENFRVKDVSAITQTWLRTTHKYKSLLITVTPVDSQTNIYYYALAREYNGKMITIVIITSDMNTIDGFAEKVSPYKTYD